MIFRLLSGLLLLPLLAACVSSIPTAAEFDRLEQQLRAEYRQDYDQLEQQRRTGQLTPAEHAQARAALDQRVRNRVDTMLWSRHALVQSDLKAHNIPTPDKPQDNTPPVVGGVQNSLYNASRQTGMGNQVMGNFMRDFGGGNFNAGRAGSVYDPE